MKKFFKIVLVIAGVVLLASSYVLASKQYIKDNHLSPPTNQISRDEASDVQVIDSFTIPSPLPTLELAVNPNSNAHDTLINQKLYDSDSEVVSTSSV
ncbi:MAG: hypothetical protein WCP03_04005 [Candidatus Saccharibacteria bacterium]